MLAGGLPDAARGQQPGAPLTSQELVKLVYQLPKHPEKRDEVVEEIRRRGIGFELTSGLRGLVATKSGNDMLLRRTLEEAERRRLDPVTAAPPAAAETAQVLEQARKVTLAAAGGLPDFVVKQLVTRAEALGTTRNWNELDRLTVAVSYRARAGEQYKLLAVNGLPAGGGPERYNYEQAGGATSTGEFASRLLVLFKEESQTRFRFAGADTLRGRRAFIYDFEVSKKAARENISWREENGDERVTTAGLKGKLWIDLETKRVLRAEFTTTEIEPDFPVKNVEQSVDYDWVEIGGQKYLLPVAAEIVGTKIVSVTDFDPRLNEKVTRKQLSQDRNTIRFRNYQKFGTEVKVLDDDDFPAEGEKKKP